MTHQGHRYQALQTMIAKLQHKPCYPFNMNRIEIGIMAHNEAGNLDALLSAVMSGPKADRVCIVSSGSTDGTDMIAKRWANKYPQIQAIIEKQRRGKAVAINQFLSSLAPQTEMVVLISGDVTPSPGSVDHLLAAFDDPEVAMAGAQPCPTNPSTGLVNKIVRFQWTLHDLIARERPKLGEMVAFRPPTVPLHPNTVVDEAALEAQLTSDGGTLAYVPQAKVFNCGPQTFADLVTQRERIWIGHRMLWKRTGYRVSTGRILDLIPAATRYLVANPGTIHVVFAAGAIELFARLRGSFRHYCLGLKPTIWPRINSAKRVQISPSSAPRASRPRA
jgi:cellulose synthase/poly-beta-1,6-N-acetylglucosamine synthase-like glycosyltransferase